MKTNPKPILLGLLAVIKCASVLSSVTIGTTSTGNFACHIECFWEADLRWACPTSEASVVLDWLYTLGCSKPW